MSKLVLIDGHSILNRAFYGVPNLTNSEGLHTNAVYGFLNILFKLLEEEKPEHLAVAFDLKAPTFRHEMYGEYKGTRKPMPQELHEQVPLMKEVLCAMGVPILTKEGYEVLKATSGMECLITLQNEDVDVVVRPEDVDVVSIEKGMLRGVVTSVTFKGVHYEIIVDIGGFKWMIQTTDKQEVGDKIGLFIEPDAIHIMKKSEYSGKYGDFSSFSDEFDELSQPDIVAEESNDED